MAGMKCDQCAEGHYGFTNGRCFACGCLPAGSLGPNCDAFGSCTQCKKNVEGAKCDTCKPGTANLQTDNPFGCSGGENILIT